MDNLKFNPLLYLYHTIGYPGQLLYFLLHTFLPQYNFIKNLPYCVFLWLYTVPKSDFCIPRNETVQCRPKSHNHVSVTKPGTI